MPVIEISDLALPELASYRNLTDASCKRPDGMMVVESRNAILHAVESGCKPVSFLMERRKLSSCSALLDHFPEIPVYTAPREVLATLTGYELTRGILSVMHSPLEKSADEICSSAYRIAVLENITDATNIGAIFRSAAALNVDCILLSPDCCDPLNRRSIRVSMGTVFQIPYSMLNTPVADCMSFLRSLGFSSAALALTDDSISIDDPSLKEKDKLAILLGSEGDGLTLHTISSCDYTVKIPMSHGVDSLNVAAASAVAFWELRKR